MKRQKAASDPCTARVARRDRARAPVARDPAGSVPVASSSANRTVELLHRSSYRIGCELRRDGTSLEQTMGLQPRDHASHGGSFPLTLAGMGCIGVVTVSGLPQRADHELTVEALAALCSVPLAEVALPPE